MKNLFIIFLIILIPQFMDSQTNKKFHDFTVKSIDGKPYDLSQLKGKKVLVVNTASKCGFTPQYADLEKLYQKYKDRNFIIIGFPANNFLRQEPGTDSEIKAFCQLNYGVTFPMMSKISVKGKDIHPLYSWLTRKELNGVLDSSVSWNFQKYMIDENGRLSGMLSPKTGPLSDEIINWIESK